MPIELGKSRGSKYVVEDDKVRLPFSALKGLGGAAAEALERVTIHGEEYLSVEELQQASGVGQRHSGPSASGGRPGRPAGEQPGELFLSQRPLHRFCAAAKVWTILNARRVRFGHFQRKNFL